jgi:hypothetical protein
MAGIEEPVILWGLFRRAAVRLLCIEGARGFEGLLGEGERLRGRSEVWIFGFEGVVVDILVFGVCYGGEGRADSPDSVVPRGFVPGCSRCGMHVPVCSCYAGDLN